MKYASLLLIPVGLLAGCNTMEMMGSKPVSIQELQEVNLEELPLPDSIKDYKVILAGVDDAHANDKLSGLGQSFEQKLRSSLFNSGVNLVAVEKSSKQKLIDEIRKYEMSGQSQYRPTAAANAAIRGYLNAANWTAGYSKADDRPSPWDSHYFGGDGCDYVAKVEGTIAVYNVNPLEREGASVAFEGTGRMHVDTSNTTCPTLPDEQYAQIFRSALDDAIKDYGGSIASNVASQGFVVWGGKAPESETVYFRLSVSPDKAKPGTRVTFLDKRAVAGEDMAEVEIATGKVVETNYPKAAFVKMDSVKDQSLIKKNTLVKLDYAADDACTGSIGAIINCAQKTIEGAMN